MLRGPLQLFFCRIIAIGGHGPCRHQNAGSLTYSSEACLSCKKHLGIEETQQTSSQHDSIRIFLSEWTLKGQLTELIVHQSPKPLLRQHFIVNSSHVSQTKTVLLLPRHQSSSPAGATQHSTLLFKLQAPILSTEGSNHTQHIDQSLPRDPQSPPMAPQTAPRLPLRRSRAHNGSPP